MGSMAPSTPPPQLSLADLKALSVLGQGARGVVFHVVPASDTTGPASTAPPNPTAAMALKTMSRAAARHKGRGRAQQDDDGHRRIWFERDVLLSLRHPLLPSLRGVVATDAVVGLAIDRCPGGDLKSLLRRRWPVPPVPEPVVRFYAAELVLALEHLHGLGVVYRDLKPDNVLIQDSGHIMLVDFDLSTTLPPPKPPPAPPPDTSSRHVITHRKKNNISSMIFSCLPSSRSSHAASASSDDDDTSSTSRTGSTSSGPRTTPAKSRSFVGTEDYVAPEIVSGSGHDHAVDWWGLGVVLYEMLYGATPFRGRIARDTFRRVLADPLPPDLRGDRTAAPPLRDLIARLLEKDPGKRIGAEGVKRHEFFRGVDWDQVLHVARPPFIPVPDEYSNEPRSEAEALDVEKVVHEAFGASETMSVKDAGSSEDGTDDDFSVFF